MKAIYEPQGKAREYSPLACNLYTGCSHGCTYCYSPTVLHMPRDQFYTKGQPRKDIIKKLKVDLLTLRNMNRKKDHVLYCFSCDPYQSPLHDQYFLMTEAIGLHYRSDIPINILTKSGNAIYDFPTLSQCNDPLFGMTLTFNDNALSSHWEPNASLPGVRYKTLAAAKASGIRTWASLEPVINATETIKCIENTHPFVDHYYLGKWNYNTDPLYEWEPMKKAIVTTLTNLKCSFTIKRGSL